MANANEMIVILSEFLRSNVGVGSITVDGQSVQYNREQAIKELLMWERRAAQGSRRSMFKTINLGNVW